MATKKQRDYAQNKFNGLCAYTGKPLDDKWQVDHITPICYCDDKVNEEENLVPCLQIVNHYKREKDLKRFREYMMDFHTRFDKYPKNPYTERSIKRKAYMQRVADAFGITTENPFNGVFYFETLVK